MQSRLLAIAYISLSCARLAYGTPTAACNALQSALPGRVFFPGSEEYATDNEHYAQSSSQNSTCSVEPETPDDVALILRTVVSGNTRSPFAVKGGGHTGNVGFSSTAGVQISMSRFNGVVYDESQSTVKIGAGLAWGEVYARLETHGVKVIGGRIPSVGVGGLLLGGGYSFFTDQYGLAVDNIVSHDLVLPNGTFAEVNEQTDPDLFFALKGGFNNFGIVTSFTLQAFPQTDVWVTTVAYPFNASDAVHRATEKFVFDNADFKAAVLCFYGAPSLNETSLSTVLFYDAPTPPSGVFNEFLSIPDAVVGISDTMSLTDALVRLNGVFLSTPPRTARHTVPVSHYTVGILDEIKTQFEKIVFDATAENRPFVLIAMIPEPFVQLNTHSTDSAYPHPPGCPTVLEAQYINAADDEFFVNAIREAQQAIHARAIEEGQSFPHDILYSNYAPAITPLELLYGSSLERLQEIKRRVDPKNIMGLAGGFKIE